MEIRPIHDGSHWLCRDAEVLLSDCLPLCIDSNAPFRCKACSEAAVDASSPSVYISFVPNEIQSGSELSIQ